MVYFIRTFPRSVVRPVVESTFNTDRIYSSDHFQSHKNLQP